MHRQWLLKTEALRYLHATLKVACFPIVPPVQMTYSAHIGATEEPIHLPGITIGAGSRDIHIEDARVQAGSLWDDVTVFKRSNPILIREGAERFAGEDLAVYGGGDYVMAVGMVERFVAEAVQRVWDAPLRLALEEARPRPPPDTPEPPVG